MTRPLREARIDLAAIANNVARLREYAGGAQLMAVVKANGYGHGAVRVAKAALAGGAGWLGVADLTEALELRSAGIDAPILAWLHDPDTDFRAAIDNRIDIGLSAPAQLRAVAAQITDTPARIQIKLDTGLSRNGVAESVWDQFFAAAAEGERAGRLIVTGLFSHLSNTSEADDLAAIERFRTGIARAHQHGLRPELTHIAASAAAISLTQARFDMVRVGIGMYGLSPFEHRSSASLDLIPAMSLHSRVNAVRRVAAGTGVSYGYTWRAERETTLVLVPVGYADGVPRAASGAGTVSIHGVRHPVRGRIAMDQFVVEVGDAMVAVGDEVVLFGDPRQGLPSADDWALAAGTINYEIVTRIGPRVERSYH